MSPIITFIIAVVFFILAANFFMLYRRLRRNRSGKSGKPAMEEKEAAKRRDREIQRRLDLEQEDAARSVELRNKTLELYEQVRKNAAASGEDTKVDK